jgi:hypothetical protein
MIYEPLTDAFSEGYYNDFRGSLPRGLLRVSTADP